QKLDKPASVVVSGDGVEIDRDLIELLSDPLVHIIRNAMDHGVEDRAGRQAAGKPEEATVTLAAAQARGRITITISDDGRGIDREKVLARAIERGLVPPGVDPKTLPDKDVFGFLFKAGFSTAEKVTDLSGRGVGLDVVKSNLEKIKGTIEVSS